mmetsp:Transcript_12060/g.39607  ORF Transcript_12060/g.39607 Transcript_12060/m.39607 type:complete len:102 (-) Transcript_12060:105-410(-)
MLLNDMMHKADACMGPTAARLWRHMYGRARPCTAQHPRIARQRKPCDGKAGPDRHIASICIKLPQTAAIVNSIFHGLLGLGALVGGVALGGSALQRGVPLC